MKNNIVGWFEIAVTDMERAIKFYEAVFAIKFQRQPMGPLDMAFFPWSEQEGASGAGGALVCYSEFYKPSTDGTLIYFTPPSGDLQNELARVEAAGGKVLQQKTLITEEIGYMAVFIDTEGNRLAFHSRQ